MEEITKAMFKEDIKYIKDECIKHKNIKECIECKFWHEDIGCIIKGIPENWNEEIITERAFRK